MLPNGVGCACLSVLRCCVSSSIPTFCSWEVPLEQGSRQPTELATRLKEPTTRLLMVPTGQATKPRMQPTMQATRPGTQPTELATRLKTPTTRQATRHRAPTTRLLTLQTGQATRPRTQPTEQELKPRMLPTVQATRLRMQPTGQELQLAMLRQASSSRHTRHWMLPSPTLTRPSRWPARLLQWHQTRRVSWLALLRLREATLSGGCPAALLYCCFPA